MQYFTSNISLLVTSLKKVTNYLIKDFSELCYMNLSNSCSNSFANKSYKFIEKKIIEDIKKIKPEYSYILNNGQIIENKDKSNYIVVSNINGFINFKRGIQLFTISIALIRDGKEFAAVVYQPLLDHLYFAEINKGAYLNKLRLKCSYSNMHKNNLLIATDNPFLLLDTLKSSKYLITHCPTLDLCFLASLKIDLCSYQNDLNYFDILPALVIAQESGYSVTYNKDHNKISNLIAANPSIRESLKI